MATYSSILAWRIPQTEEPRKAPVHGIVVSDTAEQPCTCTHTHDLKHVRLQEHTYSPQKR